MPGRHQAPERGPFRRELTAFLLVFALAVAAFLLILALIVGWGADPPPPSDGSGVTRILAVGRW